MRLTRVDIGRLPGINQRFSVDFAADSVNVITGPNGSGKSSLIRAIRALLYPDSTDTWCELSADWIDGEANHHLRCQRMGQAVSWQRDGATIPPPNLPHADNMGAFLISSEDLVGLGSTEGHISSRLRTMLAGGYDLEQALDDPRLAPRPRPQRLSRDLDQARRALQAKEREYAELDEEIQRLNSLEQELAATADAAGRLRACEDALALAQAVAQRDALEQTLIQDYPGGMDRLRGDELDRLGQIDDEIRSKQQALSLAERQIEQSREMLSKRGGTDPTALEALQSELADWRDELGDLETALVTLDERIQRGREALAKAARRLGDESIISDQQLDVATLEALEKKVERLQSEREQIRNLTAELARTHVSTNMTGRPQSDLRDARQALRRWLHAAGLSPLEGVLWGGLGLTGLIASWRVISETGSSPELILLSLLAIGVPATMLVRFINQWRDLGRARDEFLETDIEPPLGWTAEEVEARLERLETELESATRHEVSQARAAEVREQLNRQRAVLDRQRQQLADEAQRLGLSMEDRLETGFLLWCRHIADWQQLLRQVESDERERQQLRDRLDILRQEARDRLDMHQLTDVAPDARSLARLVHQLSPQIREIADHHNQLVAGQRRVEELNNDLAHLHERRHSLFDDVGLTADDLAELNHRVERFASWQALEQQGREISLDIKRLETALSREGDLLKRAHEQQRDSLQSLHARLEGKAARRDAINRQIAEIRTRHDEVVKRREIEALTLTAHQLEHQLSNELEAQMRASAAGLLLEDVRQAHRSDNEPAALKRAADWFDRFTRHRYALLFEQNQFAAHDRRNNTRHELTELSTGTRVQLLLAVRLAWVEQAEQGTLSLPVFMDEVLTTTDPDRYRAIVHCVQEIVGEGRQMFYLTAQSDDALAWQAWAGDGPEPWIIDMASVRADQVEPLAFELPRSAESPRQLPDPEGLSAIEWAERAGIEAIDPWRGFGQLHVFHLLHDDLALCVKLAELDLARLAELEAFLDSPAAGEFLDDATNERLQRRLATARQILDDWQRRHDRPAKGADLAASGLLSERFLARTAELAEQLGGDPRRLLDALRHGEVPHFRSDTADQLEAWLENQGYLNARQGVARVSNATISASTGLDPDQVADVRAWITGAIVDPLQLDQERSDQ